MPSLHSGRISTLFRKGSLLTVCLQSGTVLCFIPLVPSSKSLRFRIWVSLRVSFSFFLSLLFFFFFIPLPFDSQFPIHKALYTIHGNLRGHRLRKRLTSVRPRRWRQRAVSKYVAQMCYFKKKSGPQSGISLWKTGQARASAEKSAQPPRWVKTWSCPWVGPFGKLCGTELDLSLDTWEVFLEWTCTDFLKGSVSLLGHTGCLLETGVITFEFVIVLVPTRFPGCPENDLSSGNITKNVQLN